MPESVPLSLRAARPEEAAALSELALASKAQWGYAPELARRWRRELTYTEEQLSDPRYCFRIAEQAGELSGFIALRQVSAQEQELEAMFVHPGRLREGIGRRLMADAVEQARARGAVRLRIQSDPHAEGFYLAAGARRIGEEESASVPGRFLPLLVMELDG